VEKATRYAHSRILIKGEQGVGKLAVALAMHQLRGRDETVIVLDAADRIVEGAANWIRHTGRILTGPPATVVIRHIELLDQAGILSLAKVIDRMTDQSGIQLALTVTTSSLGGQVPLFDRFPNTIDIAPLRQRADDIPALIEQWLGKQSCTPEVVSVLMTQEWPGNVRELHELLIALCGDGERRTPLSVTDLPSQYRLRRPHGLTLLEKTEYAVIVDALTACCGNKVHAAEQIGISRSSLYRKMHSFGIHVDAFIN
jgi:DNA-binding NtrC family response regulator